jgi:transcription elongation factor GreB
VEKNYLTPQGFERLREELRQLLNVERPKVVEVVSWAAGNGDRSENGDYIYGKRRLREIDRRIRILQQRLDIAVVVDPLEIKGKTIRFSATVDLVDEDGVMKTYILVGPDELNADIGWISWLSPMGKALMGKSEGDEVVVKTPQGDRVYEITAVKYQTLVSR